MIMRCTKDAYRLSAVCSELRRFLKEPKFLEKHLSPRSPPFPNGGPNALIIQPRRRVGYTHLTLVAANPSQSLGVNLPASRSFSDKDPNPTTPRALLDAVTGKLSFTVVLLFRMKRRRLRVDTFKSETGAWSTEELGAQGAARCLGGVSPEILVATSFYWQSRSRSRLIRYDIAGNRASVVPEPPEAERSSWGVGRSVGSTGGRLRLCAFDVRDEKMGRPHELEGVHGVWVMDDAAAPWERVRGDCVRSRDPGGLRRSERRLHRRQEGQPPDAVRPRERHQGCARGALRGRSQARRALPPLRRLPFLQRVPPIGLVPWQLKVLPCRTPTLMKKIK